MDTWRGTEKAIAMNKKAIAAAKAYHGRKFLVSVGEWGTETFLVFAESKEEAAGAFEGQEKKKVREVTTCKKYN